MRLEGGDDDVAGRLDGGITQGVGLTMSEEVLKEA